MTLSSRLVVCGFWAGWGLRLGASTRSTSATTSIQAYSSLVRSWPTMASPPTFHPRPLLCLQREQGSSRCSWSSSPRPSSASCMPRLPKISIRLLVSASPRGGWTAKTLCCTEVLRNGLFKAERAGGSLTTSKNFVRCRGRRGMTGHNMCLLETRGSKTSNVASGWLGTILKRLRVCFSTRLMRMSGWIAPSCCLQTRALMACPSTFLGPMLAPHARLLKRV
mmetsp:Transcript_41338/g.80769  ORF Transcript_41338/g.80769 Transcript_41338/m.80769 type:complete len:222 (-) Transcript_41338:260-925(-)